MNKHSLIAEANTILRHINYNDMHAYKYEKGSVLRLSYCFFLSGLGMASFKDVADWIKKVSFDA